MKELLCILLAIPYMGTAQNTLTIEVGGVKSSEGYIAVGIYNGADDFLKPGKVFAGTFEEAQKGTTTILIADLPKGIYAVSVYHDENGNKELDTNFIGIPKETVGFSNAKMKTFGPPSFKECSFELTDNMELEFSL